MQIAILSAQIAAGFLLIIFGGWVTWKGIGIITQYYPLTLKPAEPPPQAFTERGQPANLVAAMIALVNAEIASLSVRKPASAFVDLDAGLPVERDSEAPAVEPVETVESEALVVPAPSAEAAGCETRDILEGAATVIEALPKLLNANFGPAAVVCLVGLLIIAGGFYLLVNLSAV